MRNKFLESLKTIKNWLNWKVLLILIIAFFIGLREFRNWNEKRVLNNRIKELKKKLNITIQEDSLQIIKLATRNDSLNGIVDNLTQVKLKWKNKYFKIKDAKQETIYVDSISREKITFEKGDLCTYVEGYTLTNPPYAEVNIQHSPINLAIILTETETGLKVGKIIQDKPCFDIKDFRIEIPENYQKPQTEFFQYGIGISTIMSSDSTFIDPVNSLSRVGLLGAIRFGRLQISGGINFRRKLQTEILWWFR